jgi:hypothetical protein
MTGWIIAAAIAVLLIALLWGPIDLRFTLDRPLKFGFRWSWIGIPLPVPKTGKGRKKSKRKKKARLAAWLRLKTGKAVIAVFRSAGFVPLVMDTARRAKRAVELVRANLLLSLWMPNPALNAGLFGVIGFLQPRMLLGRGRIHIEVVPALNGRFGAEGEMILRTQLASWIALGLRVLCAKATWRAVKAWKREQNAGSEAPAPDAEPPAEAAH